MEYVTGDDDANAMVGSGGEEGKKDRGGIILKSAELDVETVTESPVLATSRLGRDILREGLSLTGQF